LYSPISSGSKRDISKHKRNAALLARNLMDSHDRTITRIKIVFRSFCLDIDIHTAKTLFRVQKFTLVYPFLNWDNDELLQG